MALIADGAGKTQLTADGWFYQELPDGTIHSIYISVVKRPGGKYGDLWFTESWGRPVVCDNGTKRTSDDWMGYEWSIREASGRVAFKMNRHLRHAFAEGEVAASAYGYRDCDLSVEPGGIGGVDPGTADQSRVAPDRLPGAAQPAGTIHLILALDGHGRLQRPDVIAYSEDARCLDGPAGTRCGAGLGAYREATGLLVLDDIVYEVEGVLSRVPNWAEPIPMPAAEVALP
jgi:hypothetical protein